MRNSSKSIDSESSVVFTPGSDGLASVQFSDFFSYCVVILFSLVGILSSVIYSCGIQCMHHSFLLI